MSGRSSGGAEGAWPVVPLADQALYLAHTAAGHEAVIQLLWIYRHPVDLDGLRRFKSHLEQGLLARVIRPSLLPIGRHHWVAAPPSNSDLAVGSQPLSRSDLHAWADARVQLPLDPARGPAWRLSVQPVTDGSTAVSLVVSHCIADGMATIMAVCEAVRGERRPLGELRSYGRATALKREVRQLVLDGPSTLRAVTRLVGTGIGTLGTLDLRRRRSRHGRPIRSARQASSQRSTESDRAVALPSVSIRIPSSIWSARVKRAGVSDSALLTAVAAALGARLGRVRDGAVLIMFPVSLRSGSTDSGGNRVSIATLPVNVDTLSGPLKDVQRALLSKIRATRRRSGGLEALLPLIPFVPRGLVAAGSNLAFGFSANVPVTCSNVGALPPDILRIDDTEAEDFMFRGVDRRLSERSLERRGGVATLLAGFVRDSMVLNFVAWQPGAVTDSARLQTIAEQILADYDLRGEVLL
jgi:diacylglycerol O-acyltransferase / wax synthase